MFRKQCTEPLVFTFNDEMVVPLHMFFMRFPIDVIYLDKDNKISEMIINFRPWKWYSPKSKCKTIIEMPVGWIRKLGLKISDNVGWYESR